MNGSQATQPQGARVYSNFDDLFAARAATTPFVSTLPLPQQQYNPTQLSAQALISPRYDIGQPQPQVQFMNLPAGSAAMYTGLVSPRYVVPVSGPTQPMQPSSFLQPLQLQQPLQQQPLQQPTQDKQAWNPFWEDIKDTGNTVVSPRGDDEKIEVHVVEELSDDSNDDEDEDGEKYDDSRFRNFQLRTSSSKLVNSDDKDKKAKKKKSDSLQKKKSAGGTVETKTVKTVTTTTFKSVPQSKLTDPIGPVKADHEPTTNPYHEDTGRYHHRLIEQRDRSDSGAPLFQNEEPEPIKFNWHPKRAASSRVMRGLIQVNCLVKGDYTAPVPKWMIPVDNTPASERALDYVLKLAGPTDHIIIVHVREWAETDANLREAYLKWRNSVKLCRRYHKKLVAAGRPHTILVPISHDIRKIVVKFAKKFHVDTICIGKHGEQDKQYRVKNIHFRSFSKYVSNHAKHCRTMIV